MPNETKPALRLHSVNRLEGVEERNDLTPEQEDEQRLERARENLVWLARRHERREHSGQVCQHFRAVMAAYMLHALGLRTEEDLLQVVDCLRQCDADCPGCAGCRQKPRLADGR